MIDGYQMARKGRAGPALAAAGLGSFFAGCVGTLILAAFAAPLTEVAFKFGPAEYFSLMVLGLIGAVVLASGSLIKAIAMIVLGLLLGLVGTDVNSGVARYSFDIPELTDGIGFVVIAMGVFGYGEIIMQPRPRRTRNREVFTAKVTGLLPTKEDFKRMAPAILRGTALGSALGILPGGGALLAAFAAYTLEKKTKLQPGEVPFGKGNIRGVAAPESANNAGAQTSFIPLLTLGIPPNAVMALMVGAMTIHNIQPGPQVMTSNPQLFWGLIASMWIGNLMLVVLNLPLIGIWIKLLTIPYRWLFPAIVLFCAIGVYSTNNNVFDIWMVAIFGVIGYVFIKLGANRRRCCLASSSGPMMEENLRRALLLSRGDWGVFVTRPLSAGLLAAAAAAADRGADALDQGQAQRSLRGGLTGGHADPAGRRRQGTGRRPGPGPGARGPRGGHRVHRRGGRHRAAAAPYDLGILDIGLPGVSGLEVLQRLRARRSTMPVLMLTAFDTLDDRVRGLDLGADDYLTKPFDLPELEARVRALLRRGTTSATPVLEHGRCASTPSGRRVLPRQPAARAVAARAGGAGAAAAARRPRGQQGADRQPPLRLGRRGRRQRDRGLRATACARSSSPWAARSARCAAWAT